MLTKTTENGRHIFLQALTISQQATAACKTVDHSHKILKQGIAQTLGNDILTAPPETALTKVLYDTKLERLSVLMSSIVN
jgi:hypothetical protein